MADVLLQLDSGSYSAVKRPTFSTEIVTTDGGAEHHNSRWVQPLATWDISIKPCLRTAAPYTAAIALFEATLGSGLTFIFHDPVACEDVEVWIVGDTISITPLGNLVQIEMTVQEARV